MTYGDADGRRYMEYMDTIFQESVRMDALDLAHSRLILFLHLQYYSYASEKMREREVPR